MLFNLGVKETIDLYEEWLEKVDSVHWMVNDWQVEDVREALRIAIMAQKLGFTSVQVNPPMVNLLALLCEEKNK